MKNKFQKCSMISRDNFGVKILFILYTVGLIERLNLASESFLNLWDRNELFLGLLSVELDWTNNIPSDCHVVLFHI